MVERLAVDGGETLGGLAGCAVIEHGLGQLPGRFDGRAGRHVEPPEFGDNTQVPQVVVLERSQQVLHLLPVS
jgi:hypothetical protein